MEPVRIAVLVKQIPKLESMALDERGRLVREGVELELNAYCRRAVAQGVDLVAQHGGSVTVITLGPPSAEDCLREAVAWGCDRAVDTVGVLLTDPVFAGSDTLATARALGAAIEDLGPFDLVLTGRNSVDADTGQVGPELAELLDLPFATGARHLALDDGVLDLRCEHDDGWAQLRISLPAVVSTAERLIDPCKVDPEGRAAVPAASIRRLGASALGQGPWGQDGSPTAVGAVRVLDSERERHVLHGATLEEQVARAVDRLRARGALDAALDHAADLGRVPDPQAEPDRTLAVLVEPDREGLTRELLGAAASLGGLVVAITTTEPDRARLGAWGADEIVHLADLVVEEDVASGVVTWARALEPWAILAPSTAWGREVASRSAAALGTGLTGDAVRLEAEDGRLVAWKPAFGGALVAAIRSRTDPQMVTVRAGVLPAPQPRVATAPVVALPVEPRGRIELLARTRDDDLDVLAEASVVVGVGQGVAPEDYPRLEPLLQTLDAELAATRKVTDRGWLPRARQVGITGRSIAPRLYVLLGASGKFNHMVGVRGARTVLAVNPDAEAPVFEHADIGIVGCWDEVVPLLVTAFAAVATG